jgi:hypothetical protein
VLVGGAGGYAVAWATREQPARVEPTQPVAALDPMFPLNPQRPFAPDIDYPPLQPDLTYRDRRVGDPPYQWTYVAPAGWRSVVEGPDEVRWRPADEPAVGGYSLRVKVINERKSPEQMVEQKRSAVLTLYEDVAIRSQRDDLISFTYRDPGSERLRFNTFAWFVAPGSTTADFEMSVVGRRVDRDGLADLHTTVVASVRKGG